MTSANQGGFAGDSGSFTRLRDDRCERSKRLEEMTDPLRYMMDPTKYENCNKGNCGKFWRPFDSEIITASNELSGRTRVATRCPTGLYSPNCKKSASCTSTFDADMPVVMAQEVCPIVRSGLQRVNNPGYVLSNEPWCNNSAVSKKSYVSEVEN